MDTLRLGLEWFLNPDHLPFLIAREKGWLADADLEVELVAPEQHLDAMDAIDQGQLDLAITEPLHLVEDAAKGRKVKGFFRFLHTNGGVMYLGGKGIERPSDMAGKRIQYPGAPGPGGPAIVATMIEADGGAADLEAFTPVNRGFQHTDALLEDDADVATLAFYNFEVVEARHRGADAQFFALRDWGVPDFCQLVLFTSEPHLAKRRAPIERLLKVLRRGIDFAHQHPEEARAIYFARTETAPDDALMSAIFAATVPCFTFDATLAADSLDHLATWMHARGLVDRKVEAAEIWTNELAL